MAVSILLVDDSKFVRKGIAKKLPSIIENKELILTEACNGNEALEFLYANQYDIVFLDLTMPEKTGYEVLEIIQKKGIKANIIVLTADIQPDAEKIVKDLGALAYLKKESNLDKNSLVQILKEINIL